MGRPEIVVSPSDVEQGSPLSRSYGQREYEVRRSEFYNRVVKPRLHHRPWLEVVQKFMDPNAKGFAVDLDRRMTHFDIKVIHISTSGESEPVINCDTPEKFHDAVKEDKERSGTLVIAKDLSRAMIEALGTRYELEPEFFASHLGGTELYGMGYRELPTSRAPARAPILLPDYIRKASFYTAEYRRPYCIEGGLNKVFELRSSETNLARGVESVKENFPDVFVFEKISVYREKGSNVGIILTDQLLSKDPPASYMLHPVTLLDDDPVTLGNDGRSHQVSSRRELISWLQRLTPSEAKGLFNDPDHEPLALRPVLKIVERASAMFLAHARYIMNRILTRYCDDRFPDDISFFLQVSRSLHRHLHDQQKLLLSALRVAALRGGNDIAEQKRDFEFLAEDMGNALKALEEDVKFLTSAASIMEGKVVGLVSKFAALFLPVSLLATILAISDPGYTRWAILGGLSVPFVLISVYLMFFWKPVHLDSLMF